MSVNISRPFKEQRPIGPVVTFNDPEDRDDWRDMDTDVLDADPRWEWIIDDELAHFVWESAEQAKEIGFGPDPPILLSSTMGFFPDRDKSDTLNNWFHTRISGKTYDTYTDWDRIATRFSTGDPTESTTERLYSEDVTPHPLRSKLHSQQYTSNGAMFTYDFQQWQGEPVSGMMRIPVPNELLDELREQINSDRFEEFQIQSRTYSGQFSQGPTPEGTFSHPHFRQKDTLVSQSDYMELFDTAFEFMKRGVRFELNNL